MGKTLITVVAVVFVLAACGGGGTPAANHQSSSATTMPQFEGDSASSWCDYANQVDDTSQLNDAFDQDPEAWVARVTTLMSKAETSAPRPIKADVAIMVGAVRGLAQGLVANQYDLSKLSARQLTGLQDPSFVQAGLRVRAYDQQVCHTPN
jgi:hypothetical protein